MDSLKMDNLKVLASYIFQAGTIILGNLNLIKKMEEVYINGQGNSQIFMKASLLKVKEMEEVHFGGLMEVGMKDNLEMEFKVVMVFYIETVVLFNMKDHGIMVCLMEKVFSSFKMDRSMKAPLNKISFMETVYFTKMIQ